MVGDAEEEAETLLYTTGSRVHERTKYELNDLKQENKRRSRPKEQNGDQKRVPKLTEPLRYLIL